MQEIYAYHQSNDTNLPQAERHLLDSVTKLHWLFVYQLSFWVEVKRFAEQRIEENKQKNFPTEEDLNPNLKFVNNRVINALENNRDLMRLEQEYKINWADYRDDFIRSFYNRMHDIPEYQEYMSNENSSFFGFLPYSSLAQLAEHAAVNRVVVRSSRTRGARKGGQFRCNLN